jgi:hypothetical protein
VSAAILLCAALVLPYPARANWTQIPGRTISAPAAVWSPDTQKLYVVVGGGNNRLWFTEVGSDKSATPYIDIPIIAPLPPALVWDPVLHKIDLVVLGSGNTLWFAALNTDGSLYTNWKVLDGVLASPPALVWNPLIGKVQILGRTADENLWMAALNSDGTFYRDWARIAGTSPSSPAAAWDNSLQKIQVLVRAANDTLWYGTLNSDGSVYKAYANISGNTMSAPSLMYDGRANKLYAFVRGGDNEVWFSRFDSQGKSIPVWQPISGRLREPPAVALNPVDGIAYIVASMPFDYAPGIYAFVADFPVGVPQRSPQRIALTPSPAAKSAVRYDLNSAWWRKFYAFNYNDIKSRQGGNNPPGFLLESLTSAYAPSYFPRTGGALVKLWLSTGDFKRARDVLAYTLDITARAGRNRVPHYVLTSGQLDMIDQTDGQAAIILAWALYARQVHDQMFVASTYQQVASLMDAALAPPYFSPSFGLVRNFNFEHYREERLWDTYDILTQSYVAQALTEMIEIAKSRGDAAHAQKWQNDKSILEGAIARKLTWNFDGQKVYAEMFDDKSTTQLFLGLSEFNFGPTAAGWKNVDPKVYAQTVNALMQYASFVWHGNRVISVGFSKGFDPVPITSGKLLAWQMLYFAQHGEWDQVRQTLSFIKDEQQRNNQPRVFEAAQVKISPASVDVFNGAGNGEQTVWMLYALHEVAKLAGAKPL